MGGKYMKPKFSEIIKKLILLYFTGNTSDMNINNTEHK